MDGSSIGLSPAILLWDFLRAAGQGQFAEGDWVFSSNRGGDQELGPEPCCLTPLGYDLVSPVG